MSTYNKRISLESNHLYESFMGNDHYDLCNDAVRRMIETDSTKEDSWHDILDVEYITPIELESCHENHDSNYKIDSSVEKVLKCKK